MHTLYILAHTLRNAHRGLIHEAKLWYCSVVVVRLGQYSAYHLHTKMNKDKTTMSSGDESNSNASSEAEETHEEVMARKKKEVREMLKKQVETNQKAAAGRNEMGKAGVIVCCVAIFRSNNCDAFFLVFCPFY
jgi:hypothetical protein